MQGEDRSDGQGASVLVDARALKASGIGRYLREVIAHLLKDNRFSRVTLLGDVPALMAFSDGVDGSVDARYHSYPTGFYSPRVQLEWLRFALGVDGHPGVAFFPHYDAPVLRMPERSVVTIQDLIHFVVPDAFPAWRRAAAAIVLRRITATAKRIVVSSESTRRDLVDRLPWTADKIRVVPFGVDPCQFGEARDRLGTDDPASRWGPYVLCVGNQKPHKNLIAAVESISRLPAEHADLKLVIAGVAFRGSDDIMHRAAELGIGERVIRIGEVSDELLGSLYSGCEALLFPSLYEGFGLPILEAMAMGAPVVASRTSSIPEVAGDAGILVEPDDYSGMARAIARIRSDPEFRSVLIARGRERAASFKWEDAANRVADILWETSQGLEKT